MTVNRPTSVSSWVERLSLDAVAVALGWGLALGGDHAGGLEVLLLATWLTYVADRLWEVRPGRTAPRTDRHLFYQRHYRMWRLIWAGGFLLAVGLAVLRLPAWKLVGGWILVAGIVVYLYILGKGLSPDIRLALKRTVVPLIFTAGVLWMTESWRQPELLLGTGVLLCGALVNVILVTLHERPDRELPELLRLLYACGMGGLMGLAVIGLMLGPAVAWSASAAFTGFFILRMLILRRRPGRLRLAADLVLLLAGCVFLVAQS